MTASFTAIVEQGRLRPLTPLGLADGVSVQVVIIAADKHLATGESPAEILSAIAAIPSEPVDPQTSMRHDEVLYSREAHP